LSPEFTFYSGHTQKNIGYGFERFEGESAMAGCPFVFYLVIPRYLTPRRFRQLKEPLGQLGAQLVVRFYPDIFQRRLIEYPFDVVRRQPVSLAAIFYQEGGLNVPDVNVN
jgi:hypothetical protein